jgi:hypothetical protein
MRAARGPQVRGKKRRGGHEKEITIEELRKINEEAYQEARREAEHRSYLKTLWSTPEDQV